MIDKVDLNTVAPAEAGAGNRDPAGDRNPALRLPDGHACGAFTTTTCSSGAEIRASTGRNWWTRSSAATARSATTTRSASDQRYFNAELEQHTYDPDKAKFHLKEAGHGYARRAAFGRRLRPSRARSTRRCSVSGARGGCGHQHRRGPRAERRLLGQRLDEEAVLCVLLGRTAHRRSDVLDRYAAGAPWNESFWDNARFNELLHLRAVGTRRRQASRRCIARCRDLCSNEGGTVIPMYASYVMAHTEKLGIPEVIGANWASTASAHSSAGGSPDLPWPRRLSPGPFAPWGPSRVKSWHN